MTSSLLLIGLLILGSAFFSMAELSLAASRRLNLQQRADAGDSRAVRVLAVQEQPGDYFTVVQIGVNTVAILAGIVGEGAFTPHFEALLRVALSPELAATLGFAASFATITAMFIVLADLVPKRLSMNEPERVAMMLVGPMLLLCRALRPLAWAFSGITEGLIRVLGLPAKRDETISYRDILALTEAGYQAGVVAGEEQQVIANVFELDTRTVETVMTTRERIVFFALDEDEALIRTRIAESPHSTYLVCKEEIDEVVGYVDATDLFQRVLRAEPISLAQDGLVKKVLIVPDRLTLSEMLTQFREAHEDFAVIVNEYSLVVGVVTLNDVMSTVMGALVAPHDEEQIVRREDGSFLADGITPIPDVERALGIDGWPHAGQYDTLAGFLMVMLRRIPRRTDVVEWEGWRFEVVDVDSHRVDQVMITRGARAA
ncbi:MAG: HlyC/CorC family transporter [Proteobacteria bacterium]|jgi:CBS domain containing-hemolysin-like protein|nr:hemolysin family protein [Burkholderiaceae bacterium]MCH8855971.1 HlyC/CorC family transporter [Pseudomonadota bacterium]|mmetsp:Transcript_10595/g.43230  ORF Transcript_10595/g.43230 Transcript_10595/m.43230 type:complete len:430 (+) Transcript_10595:3229-4518(+)